MIIGNFKFDAEDNSYRGDIVALTWSRSSVRFLPSEKTSGDQPDYRVLWGNADEVEFGAAWKRTSKGGQDFLSVLIDDPALPGPLNAALFHDRQGETAQLVWRRANGKVGATPNPEPEAKPKAAAKAKAPAKGA